MATTYGSTGTAAKASSGSWDQSLGMTQGGINLAWD